MHMLPPRTTRACCLPALRAPCCQSGYTSFGVACLFGDTAVVGSMVPLGADVNGGDHNPLCNAVKGSPGAAMYRCGATRAQVQGALRVLSAGSGVGRWSVQAGHQPDRHPLLLLCAACA